MRVSSTAGAVAVGTGHRPLRQEQLPCGKRLLLPTKRQAARMKNQKTELEG